MYIYVHIYIGQVYDINIKKSLKLLVPRVYAHTT